MGGYRKDDGNRRSQSPDYTPEGADFQYALKLSAELNGELGGHAEAAATAAKRRAQYEDHFDMALKTEFDDNRSTTSGLPSSYALGAGSSSLPAARSQDASKSTATIVEPETRTGRVYTSFSAFSDYIKASACSECSEPFFGSESDVKKLFQVWYNDKGNLSSLLTCKVCNVSACFACKATTYSDLSKVNTDDRSVSWCCHDGRLLVIWMLLCGFDASYCEVKAKSTKETEAAKKPEPSSKDKDKGKGKAKAGQPVQHSGIGYGGSNDFGYHPWDGIDEEFDPELVSTESLLQALVKKGEESLRGVTGPGRTISDEKSQAFESQRAMDKLSATMFELLQHILPCLERSHSFDMHPPAIIVEMLLESKLLDYCSELLSNRSLDDVSSRQATYDALLDFVKVISMHHATAGLTVFLGKVKQPEQQNLLTQTYHHVQPSSSATAPSLADSLRDLSKLSSVLLRHIEYSRTTYSTGQDQEMMSLCRKISDLWASLSAHILDSDHGDSANSLGAGVAAIGDVTDSQIYTSHDFATQARGQFRSAPGRFKRLVSEINVLKASLPPGIFVRHGESRLGMMKFIIIGPEGSPYENGMWEFDMYCPAEYPSVPPMVSFKTTGGGRHGLNPNLYPDGKVCLSLLGTWQGEPWKPGQSTLLQVLVSLQAMVFCEQPWYNEPGRERSFASGVACKAADRYNRGIRELTVRLGMLNWLEKTPQMWQDVVEQHFKSNADRLLSTVVEWSKQSNPRPRQPGPPCDISDMPEFHEFAGGAREAGYKTLLPRLHGLLQKYGATVALPDIREADTEPRAKKARVDGLQVESAQDGDVPPDEEPLASDLGSDDMPPLEDQDDVEDMDEFFDDIFGPLAVMYGGLGGSGANRGGSSFRGRGQVLGAGPDDSARLAPPPTSNRGRGRGRGRGGPGHILTGFGHGHGRGRGTAEVYDPHGTLHDIMYGKGRRLGDGEDKTGRGGRGGGFTNGVGRGGGEDGGGGSMV